ncbi:alginate lyase family protein [Curvibacter sp. HBC61]|uniref:Alginate lyase family protein n=1 Tax=Curvibacter cyanobacteriorum TaxID=3026422 RepID=A0ABT5MZU8_9BURK|nr:alginate lyase family protein [Curvibacter sp. HBC61]MDD0839579.1 alginate lyase family protein [Curvibacter sp. HBC61]
MKPVLLTWLPLLLSVGAGLPGAAVAAAPAASAGGMVAVPPSAPLGPAAFWPPERQWQRLRERTAQEPALAAYVQAQYRWVAQHWDRAPGVPARLAPEPAPTPEGLVELQALGFLFQMTGEAAYAQRASQVLQAWAARLPPSGEPLEASRLEPALWAYRLLRPALPAPERARIDAWWQAWAQALWASRDLSGPSAQDRQHSHRLKTVGLIGLALGDAGWVSRVRLGLQQQLMDNLLPDGASLDYQARQQLADQVDDLRALLTLALALRGSGPDLYRWGTPSGASMAHSVAWTLAREAEARGPSPRRSAAITGRPAAGAWQAFVVLVQALQPGMVPPGAAGGPVLTGVPGDADDLGLGDLGRGVALRAWLNSVAGDRLPP